MASAKGNIAARVTEIIRPVIDELGYDIWDVEYVKEGAAWHLRITIDSSDGIDIDDCEKVHRAIDPVLDEFDPIEEAYYLDVSSPGLEREIRTAEHYSACLGEMVEVKLYTASSEGLKSFVGKLENFDAGNDTVEFSIGEKHVTLERKKISKCNVYFDFDNDFLTEDSENNE